MRWIQDILQKKFGLVKRIKRDNRGMSGVLLAATLVPILGVVGIATDISRAYIVKSRLSSALDAAALAGGKSFYDEDRTQQIRKYFDSNYPAGFFGSTVNGPTEMDANGNALPPNHVYDPNETVLRLTASANLPTTFMALFNHDSLDVGTASEVSREVVLMDVVLAMDMSGSMNRTDVGGGSRISAAKDAAVSLVEILFGEQEENALLNIGLVPWSGKVNVTENGTQYGFDQFGNALTEAEKVTKVAVASTPPNPYKKENYVFDMNDDGDTTDPGEFVLKNHTVNLTHTYYAHNAPSVPLLAQPEDGWTGCVYARYARQKPWREDAYTYNDSAAEDDAADIIDGPVEPIGGTAWLGWYPMGSEGDGSSCSVRGLNNYRTKCTACPNYGITPLQHRKSVMLSRINELEISGGSYYTNIPQGLAWAWRTISPGEPFNEASVVDIAGYKKHKVIILLTDGANTRRSADAYNYAMLDRDQRLLDVAQNIKNDDVLIYTIQFAESSGALGDLLRGVATDADHYFFAPDSAALSGVFQKIANELSNLRLSK